MKNEFDLRENLSKNELLSLLKIHADANNKLEFQVSKLEFQNNELESKNNKLESKSSELEFQVSKLDQEVSYLKFQIEQYKRALFGSKRERFVSEPNCEQLQLPFEVDENEVLQEVEKVVERIEYEREKPSKKSIQAV